MNIARSPVDSEDCRQKKQEQAKPRERVCGVHIQGMKCRDDGQCRAGPKGPSRNRPNYVSATPGPGDEQKDMAEQQREAFVASRPVPSVNLVIHQPLICAANGNRNSRQKIAAWNCDDKSSKPWCGIFPETGLPAEDQAEDIEKPSPGIFV